MSFRRLAVSYLAVIMLLASASASFACGLCGRAQSQGCCNLSRFYSTPANGGHFGYSNSQAAYNNSLNYSDCNSASGYGGAGAQSVHQATGGNVAYVERTVYVPRQVTQMQRRVSTTYRNEVRTRNVTVYKTVPETKEVEREYTEMVPEQKTRTESYMVNKPVVKNVKQTYQANVPVVREYQENYTVMVPRQEMRQGVRQVTVNVPVTQTRTVTRDMGRWEERLYQVAPSMTQGALSAGSGGCMSGASTYGSSGYGGSGYGGLSGGVGGCVGASASAPANSGACGPQNLSAQASSCNSAAPGAYGYNNAHSGGPGYGGAPNYGALGGYNSMSGGNGVGGNGGANYVRRRVWVPNVVQQQVPYTVNQQRVQQQTYNYPVTVCRPETRTRTVRRHEQQMQTFTRIVPVTEYQQEKKTREVPYTVYTPKTKTRKEKVTTYKQVPEEKVERYTVQVPQQVVQEFPVQATQWVAQRVVVPVRISGNEGCSGCGCYQQ